MRQEADFAERRNRQNAINERLFEGDLEDEALPYRDTPAFEADWGGVFMSVSALQEKMDDYANTQCTKVPEVAALAERVGQALTPVQLFPYCSHACCAVSTDVRARAVTNSPSWP